MRIIIPPVPSSVHNPRRITRISPFSYYACSLDLFLRRKVLAHRRLQCGRVRVLRVLVRGQGFTAEGQFEFLGNLRPEFAQRVESQALEQAGGHSLRRGTEPASVVPLIGLAQ